MIVDARRENKKRIGNDLRYYLCRPKGPKVKALKDDGGYYISLLFSARGPAPRARQKAKNNAKYAAVPAIFPPARSDQRLETISSSIFRPAKGAAAVGDMARKNNRFYALGLRAGPKGWEI